MTEDANRGAPARVLELYPGLEGARSAPIEQGWIHQTWRVDGEAGSFVLQRVNPLFSPAIHENIEAVTARLAERGLETPRLCRTRSGALYADLGDEGLYRLMSFVDGVAHDTCATPALAASAGRLVARFHTALQDLDHAFAPLGFPFHETEVYFEALRAALREHGDHRLHSQVATLAGEIEDVVAAWEPLGPVPERVVHLDLKFNNILFREAGAGEEAFCLIDLDTLSRMPLWVELGDAWRSWCNRRPEHEAEAEYAADRFEASAGAWLETIGFTPDRTELSSLAHAIERLTVELASRFAADALRESYFGWNADLFETRGDHNLSRARGQLSMHRQTRETRDARLRFLLS